MGDLFMRKIHLDSPMRRISIMKMETLEQFFDRSYATLDKVFVYPVKRNVGKPEIWTLQQRKQYVNYLNQNSIEI